MDIENSRIFEDLQLHQREQQGDLLALASQLEDLTESRNEDAITISRLEACKADKNLVSNIPSARERRGRESGRGAVRVGEGQ